MFTGIIEETGVVRGFSRAGEPARLTVAARRVAQGSAVGDSLAVNGVCLTVVGVSDSGFAADVAAETVRRTTLARLRVGQRVNLERALPAGGRMGGHFVTGHVDGVGTVADVRRGEGGAVMEFRVPPEFARYLVEKGSIAVDGVSLTVAALTPTGFTVSLIPHTLAVTNLVDRAPGDEVNLEFDLIGKYVDRLLEARGAASPAKSPPRLSVEFLAAHGFVNEE